MKIMPKFTLGCLVAGLLAAQPPSSARAVDLLEHYPTTLTAGDATPDHARAWDFTATDIFHLTQFEYKTGDQLKVTTGEADLGVGHCADGAVWAVVIPRDHGVLTSSAAKSDEKVAHVWLRFHPGEIGHLFPATTVLADGDASLKEKIQAVVNDKFRSSWHAGMNAMIPEPKELTVYVQTKAGARRFFMVNTQTQTAEYVAAFNSGSDSTPLTWESAPPVVIKTFPEAGSTKVKPGITEIKISFNKEMMDKSWSWCDAWENSAPEGIEDPKYDASHHTCVLKVKLEPNKAYGYWINSKSYHNFKDQAGHAAVPYLLVFQTKSK